MFFCTVNHLLAGFKFTYGSSFQQEFGNLSNVQMTEQNVKCASLLVDKWVNKIKYFWSADDGLLGFTLIGVDATEYTVKA